MADMVEYIEKQFSDGYSKETVRKNLRNQGHKDSQINQWFGEAITRGIFEKDRNQIKDDAKKDEFFDKEKSYDEKYNQEEDIKPNKNIAIDYSALGQIVDKNLITAYILAVLIPIIGIIYSIIYMNKADEKMKPKFRTALYIALAIFTLKIIFTGFAFVPALVSLF